jgi:hypothetical protein
MGGIHFQEIRHRKAFTQLILLPKKKAGSHLNESAFFALNGRQFNLSPI